MKLRHAFTGHTYERLSDGLVLVEDPATGQSGIFDYTGRWRSGDLKSAEIHMLSWVGGPHAGTNVNLMAGASGVPDESPASPTVPDE
jgi:hypothetical protein